MWVGPHRMTELYRAIFTMNISEASDATGVSQRMIRHYEKIGLIPAPSRRFDRYRDYTEADLDRLRLISKARFVGFPIEDVRDLLSLWSPQSSDVPSVSQAARAKAELFKRRIETLEELRQTVLSLADQVLQDGSAVA